MVKIIEQLQSVLLTIGVFSIMILIAYNKLKDTKTFKNIKKIRDKIKNRKKKKNIKKKDDEKLNYFFLEDMENLEDDKKQK